MLQCARSGTSIKGSIVANFLRPIRLLCIKARFVGVQTIVEPQKAGGSSESAVSCFVELEQQCWAASAASGGDGLQELSGHMCFSFDLQLPPNLPASFKWLGPDASSASVEYRIVPLCVAAPDGRAEAAVRAHAQPLKLQEALQLPLLMTGAIANSSTRMKLDQAGGCVELALQLPRTLLFAGETVVAVATVCNKSRCAPLSRDLLCRSLSYCTPPPLICSRRFDRMSIAVTQTVTCQASSGVLTQSTTVIEVRRAA
jgi:hypothetical protein